MNGEAHLIDIVQWLLLLLLSTAVLYLFQKINKKDYGPAVFGVPIGTLLEDVRRTTQSGQVVSLRGRRSGTLLVFVSTHCIMCKQLYPQLPAFLGDTPVYCMMMGEPEAIAHTAMEYKLDHVIPLLKEDMEQFQIKTFPYAYYVSSSGEVSAKGLVSRPEDFYELVYNGKLHDIRKAV